MRILTGQITSSNVDIEVSPFREHVIMLSGTFSSNTVTLQAEIDGAYVPLHAFTAPEGKNVLIPGGRIRFTPSAAVTVTYLVREVAADPKDISEFKPVQL